MNASFGRWAAMVACVVSGVVHAEVQTLVVGENVSHAGWSVVVPEGRATLRLSSQLDGFLAITQATAAGAGPATLEAASSLFSLMAPATSLTGDLGDRSVTVQALHTAGGFTLSTPASVASHGTGFLRISNLHFDLLNHDIRADIEGGHGVGVVQGHRLWTFAAPSQPLVMTVQGSLTPGHVAASNEISLAGVYLTAEGLDMLHRALNLNDIGRAMLEASTHNEAGFGTFVLTAVPEPSSWTMVGAGVFGLGFMARRRHSSMNRRGS